MTTPLRIRQQKTQTTVSLGTVLAINQAQDVYKLLTPVLDRGLPVVIDAKQVQRIDCAMLQLFTAFCRTLRKHGTSAKIRKPSEVFCRSAARLGMTSELGIGTGK